MASAAEIDKKTVEKIKKMGFKVIDDIEKRNNPNIEIPIRALSNIIYDKKTGQLMLGDKSAKRWFFNVAHSRKFMQTLMVMSFTKQLVDEKIHTINQRHVLQLEAYAS